MVQPDDKILTGGRGFLKGNGTKTFRIDRLLKEGSADNTFGVKGTVLVNFHFVQNKDGYIADLTALALQADGKILACSTYIKNYYD